MGIGSKTVKTFTGKVPWAKVIEKAGGAKERGERLWPSRTSKNDSELNFRLDKGSIDSKTGEVEIILQANKNAKDPEVKKAAQKDSDAILGKGLIPRSWILQRQRKISSGHSRSEVRVFPRRLTLLCWSFRRYSRPKGFISTTVHMSCPFGQSRPKTSHPVFND